MTEATPYWAIVEIMGHRQRAGLCQEVDQFGVKMLRVDIPTAGGDVTEFYGGSAIYALRPGTEDVVREVADRLSDPRPVQPVSFRLPAPAPEPDLFDDENDERPF